MNAQLHGETYSYINNVAYNDGGDGFDLGFSNGATVQNNISYNNGTDWNFGKSQISINRWTLEQDPPQPDRPGKPPEGSGMTYPPAKTEVSHNLFYSSRNTKIAAIPGRHFPGHPWPGVCADSDLAAFEKTINMAPYSRYGSASNNISKDPMFRDTYFPVLMKTGQESQRKSTIPPTKSQTENS